MKKKKKKYLIKLHFLSIHFSFKVNTQYFHDRLFSLLLTYSINLYLELVENSINKHKTKILKIAIFYQAARDHAETRFF